ncbi:MAG: hypothetical protein IPF54_15445 [Draconibacterium sp.]|nr:hypothetical protein [Draconibacterium sp.]
MKLFMSQAFFDGKLKMKDNGKSEVFLNFEQALDVIRKIDNLTLGIPKDRDLAGNAIQWARLKISRVV